MLPTPRQILDSLLPPKSPYSTGPASSPSYPLQPHQKPLFLTLHCLFPNELLPALDLLDRRLVTRFILQDLGSMSSPHTESGPPVEGAVEIEHAIDAQGSPSLLRESGHPKRVVYYVRSSQQPRSRFISKRSESTATEGMSYEVRLQAWNCSCAAFTFAAFDGEWSALSELYGQDADEDGREGAGQEHAKNRGAWKIGGMALGKGVPICKHLLACILAERIEGLEEFVEERMVSREEMAGWAAGWGG